MAVRREVRQPSRLHAALLRSRPLQGPSAHGCHANSNASSTTLRIRRSHFIKTLAPQWSDLLVQHAQQAAAKAGRTYLYRTGSFKKEQWAEQLIREQRIESGLVGVLCTQETCNSFVLVPAPERLDSSPSHGCNVFFTGTFSTENSASSTRLQTSALHPAGLRQRARLARPATRSSQDRLRPQAQRLHPARRPGQGTAAGRSFRQARLAQNPGPLCAPRQSSVATPQSLRATVCVGSSIRPSSPPISSSKAPPRSPASIGSCWSSRA